jgi:rhodanese-related sulfurtransferase/DNA-binding transcriptional ArsR family regulator
MVVMPDEQNVLYPTAAMQFRDEVFGHFARMGAAFGHARRLQLIMVLSQGERSVETLANEVGSTVANTSRHLRILAGAGLVTRRADGTSRIYRLSSPAVAEAYHTLIKLAEQHIADVSSLADAFFDEIDGTTPISLEELAEISREGNVMLVDVRPPQEYAHGHLDGAINLPVGEIAGRLAELPPDSKIVAYCRGPYCVMSATAVHQLRAAGYDAVRLAEAFTPTG